MGRGGITMEDRELTAREEKERERQIQKNIEDRVRKLERSNYINKKLSSDEMVKKIRKIVEEEVK